jgi:hypothetical protein
MRQFVLFTVVATVFAVPAAASAFISVGNDEDGALSVKNGHGKVTLYPFNGSAVGRVAHGRVVINDPIDGDGEGFDVWGCDIRVHRSDTATVCIGDNLRFRAVGGRYKIFARGSGIFLSAVGRGVATIDGSGDDPFVDSDGAFSVNDSPYRSLPDSEKQFQLTVPSGG